MSNTKERYISSRVVLGRVSSMFHGTDWRENAIMYLGKGIQILGYNHSTKVSFTPEDEPLVIVNHKVEIPCDVEEIVEVHYLGCRLPINRDVSMLGLTCDNYVWGENGYYYMIDYPYIKTSFETGEITLFYKEFRFDDDGFIMIPDNGYYREALEWYIVYNLLLDGQIPKNNQIDLVYADTKHEIAKNKGRSVLKSMSKDRRRAFSEQWNAISVGYNTKSISQ